MATKKSLKRDFCEVSECAEYQPCPNHKEEGPSIEKSARAAVARADLIDQDPLKCPKCWTLASLCYCSKLQTVSLNFLSIWVYTHYLELTKQRGSNTGKLVCLGAGGKKIIYGIPEQEAEMVRSLLAVPPTRRFVLFPSASAMNTETFLRQYEETTKIEAPSLATNVSQTLHVVIFDGTWGQAKTLFKRFQQLGLSDTPFVSLMHASRTDFGPLRKLRIGGTKVPAVPVPSRRRPEGCFRCRSLRHRVAECPVQGVKCFTCGLEGHAKQDCQTRPEQFVCTYCASPAHRSLVCPQADRDLVELGLALAPEPASEIPNEPSSNEPSETSSEQTGEGKEDKEAGLDRVSTLGAFAQLLTELRYPAQVTDILASNLRLCIEAYHLQCPSKPHLLA